MKKALVFCLILFAFQQSALAQDSQDIRVLIKSITNLGTQLSETALEISNFIYARMETSGENVDTVGLSMIRDALSIYINLFSCSKKVLIVYSTVNSEKKVQISLYLYNSNLSENEGFDNVEKQFWQGYFALEKKSSLNIADKAKKQIKEAKELRKQIIDFYASEHSKWSQK